MQKLVFALFFTVKTDAALFNVPAGYFCECIARQNVTLGIVREGEVPMATHRIRPSGVTAISISFLSFVKSTS